MGYDDPEEYDESQESWGIYEEYDIDGFSDLDFDEIVCNMMFTNL